MTWKLEKATVGVPNLAAVIVAVGLGISWAVAHAEDIEDTRKKVEPLVADVAAIKTEQAVMIERMKTLEEAVKELKQDQKDGFQRILDKLDGKR